MKTYHILLVDDHPLITTAYKKVFQRIELQQEDIYFSLHIAHDLNQASHMLEKFNTHQPLNMLMVDLRLPPSPKINLLSGEDFALVVKEKYPEVQLIIATTINNNFRIHNLFKSLDPDGFLVKNDLTEKELRHCIEDILHGTPYFSKTVRIALKQYVSNDMLLDTIDRQILYYLSLGTKTKNLPQILPLSQPGIDRRKKLLKEMFGVEDDDDKALLQKARDLGFI